MENAALLIIDIQNIYFHEGKFYLPDAKAAVNNAKKILDVWRDNEKTVIHVKHHFHLSEQEDYLNCINEKVAPLQDELVIEKKYPNSFLETNLLKNLQQRKISHVVIVGMMSNMCIDTTVRACQNYGIKVTLIHDACAAKPITFYNEVITADIVHKVFMGALDGMFADVIDTKSVLAYV
ncbi:cysteine hydrolase family protein [Propionispira raffinosivorans]|uniref:cysteine hydrolase family protein n=1 Tax=Propionispira raffinosivorans TaxID=86959 RepID=UPI0003663F18|nr:cysteine hydrolase family protein [Propionispira raffinosivorans]